MLARYALILIRTNLLTVVLVDHWPAMYHHFVCFRLVRPRHCHYSNYQLDPTDSRAVNDDDCCCCCCCYYWNYWALVQPVCRWHSRDAAGDCCVAALQAELGVVAAVMTAVGKRRRPIHLVVQPTCPNPIHMGKFGWICVFRLVFFLFRDECVGGNKITENYLFVF
jgi:hypothetical protein